MHKGIGIYYIIWRYIIMEALPQFSLKKRQILNTLPSPWLRSVNPTKVERSAEIKQAKITVIENMFRCSPSHE